MFYGWILLVVLCFVYALGIGPPFYGFGVALPSTAEALGLSRTQAASAFSAMTLLIGLSGPITAVLMRRIGMRLTMVAGSLLITAGASLVAVSSSFLAYVLGGGVMMGFGVGFMTILPGTTLINTWFARRRALAMGLFLTAGGIGGFASARLINSLVESSGSYRAAWWLMAGAALVGGLLALVFVRESPEALGQHSDGIDPHDSTAAGGPARPARVYQTAQEWQAARALRTTTFWFIVACNAVFGLGLHIVNSQLVAHLTGIGVATAVAAGALGTMALVSAGSRLVGGVIGDWVEPRYLLALGLAGQVAGILLLGNATSTTLIYAFVVLFGGGYGMAYLSVPPLVANYFGPAAYPSLFGILLPVGTVIGATGPLIAGAVFDATGDYQPVFLGFAVVAATAAVVALFTRPPGVAGSVGSRAHAGRGAPAEG